MKTRCLVLLTTAFLHTGCIGLTVVAGTKQVDSGKSVGPEVGDNGYDWGGCTKAEVLRKWGEPNRSFVRQGREYWVYKKGLTWRGAVAWVVVPIPLLVPVGRHKSRLQFQDDNLIKYTASYGLETSFGLFYGDAHGFEFMAGQQGTGDGW